MPVAWLWCWASSNWGPWALPATCGSTMAPTTRAIRSAFPATSPTQGTSMKLFQRMFFAVLLAGLISGLGLAAIQQWRVAPLILAAETYEEADAAAAEAAP